MRLPDSLCNTRLVHWNYVVRGVVEIWEIAREGGWAQELERLLEDDEDCRLVETVGRLGNELLSRSATLGLHRRNSRGLPLPELRSMLLPELRSHNRACCGRCGAPVLNGTASGGH